MAVHAQHRDEHSNHAHQTSHREHARASAAMAACSLRCGAHNGRFWPRPTMLGVTAATSGGRFAMQEDFDSVDKNESKDTKGPR